MDGGTWWIDGGGGGVAVEVVVMGGDGVGEGAREMLPRWSGAEN